MVDKITKIIELDLSKIPTSKRSQIKQEVGEFVIDEILRRVADGKSPLKGSPRWRQLNYEYSKEEKGGDRTPNLELTGELLDSLQFKPTENGIEVGHFSGPLDKADGHNNFSGESKLPLRRYIPAEDEDFNFTITSGIEKIISEQEELIEVDVSTEEGTSVKAVDIFSFDLFRRIASGKNNE